MTARSYTLLSIPFPAWLLASVFLTPTVEADDWPQWRGPNRDGVSREHGLVDSWPEAGPPLAWTAEDLGIGYATVAIASGKIVTLGARGNTEWVFALNADGGKELWRTQNGGLYKNNRGNGPRAAPTIDGNRVYALGGRGDLSCLDLRTGDVIWTVNLLDAFRARNISWGISESPLVLEDRVLVNAGGPNASIVALDKQNGTVLWKSQSDEAGYSSAVEASIGGVRQAVFLTGERLLGVRIDDGELLWHYRRVSNRTANVATPIVRGNKVFASTDYGTGCALIAVEGNAQGMRAREIYFHRNMRNHHASSVLVGDTIYGFSSSILTALDFETGELLWKDRSVGKGSLIYADGNLYVFSEDGVAALVAATREGYREKGRFRIHPRSSRPSWSHPVVANARLYLRDQDRLFVYNLSGRP